MRRQHSESLLVSGTVFCRPEKRVIGMMATNELMRFGWQGEEFGLKPLQADCLANSLVFEEGEVVYCFNIWSFERRKNL